MNTFIDKAKAQVASTPNEPPAGLCLHGNQNSGCNHPCIRTDNAIINLNTKKRFAVSNVKYNGHDTEDDPNSNRYAEVIFKSKRKAIYVNNNDLQLNDDEFVVVQVDNGFDIGTVYSCGLNAFEKFEIKKEDYVKVFSIIRHANDYDFEKYMQNSDDEQTVVQKTKSMVKDYNLDMKVTDAEWQFDRQRLTISFTAPQRIDFRQLVKELARTFKTRIELRQISSREEAKRIGGMGSCGRTLCCSSFAHDFCHVTLDHARAQQLSNNVAKLSGYCGRLKCCLLYEYDLYVEAFKKFPPISSILQLKEGPARVVKADIFKNSVFVHIERSGVYKSLSYDEVMELKKQRKIQYPRNNGYHDLSAEELKELKQLED